MTRFHAALARTSRATRRNVARSSSLMPENMGKDIWGEVGRGHGGPGHGGPGERWRGYMLGRVDIQAGLVMIR